MSLKWSLIIMLVGLAVTVASFAGFRTLRKEHKGEKYTRYENRLMLIAMYSSVFFVIGLTNSLCKQFSMSEDVRNSWIMVWLCIPSAFATTVFIPWLLEYLCSLNTVLSGKIVPKLVTSRWGGSESTLNLGVTNTFKGLIYLFWAMPAAAFWAFPKLAATFIEYWEFGIESQINLLINGAPWEKFLISVTISLLFIIIVSGYSYFNNLYKNVKEWLKNKQAYKGGTLPYPVKKTERRFVVSLLVFKLYTYWYLYGFNKVAMRNMLFWLLVIFLIFSLYWINRIITEIRIVDNTTTNTGNSAGNDTGTDEPLL